jgi:hypothetical protein
VVGATILLGGLSAGVYQVAHRNTGTENATSTFCASLAVSTQLIYDNEDTVPDLHTALDADAAAGGGVPSDTTALELAITGENLAAADKYLVALAALCQANGSPLPALVTTGPQQP